MSTVAPEREDTGTVTIEELDELTRHDPPPCQMADTLFGFETPCARPSVAVLRVRCPTCGHGTAWICQWHLDIIRAGQCVHCHRCGRHVGIGGVS